MPTDYTHPAIQTPSPISQLFQKKQKPPLFIILALNRRCAPRLPRRTCEGGVRPGWPPHSHGSVSRHPRSLSPLIWGGCPLSRAPHLPRGQRSSLTARIPARSHMWPSGETRASAPWISSLLTRIKRDAQVGWGGGAELNTSYSVTHQC